MIMQVSKEVEEHGDIVLVREKTNYKSILLKTFFVLEYAIKHYDVRYILKTDDDAYVHVEALVHQLKLLCISPDCRCVQPHPSRCRRPLVVLAPAAADIGDRLCKSLASALPCRVEERQTCSQIGCKFHITVSLHTTHSQGNGPHWA